MDINYINLELDNHGERLIPGYSHDALEYIRHRSTYQVFRNIIERDILENPMLLKQPIKILDLGCGSGHGSFLLAQITNTVVYGIDISEEAIRFAKEDYAQTNIVYRQANVDDFLEEGNVFDYAVSRHALEHMQNAKDIISKLKFNNRLLLSVPYKEPEGNEFHVYNNIDETFFSALSNAEFIYENLQGINDVKEFQSEITNSISCISSKPGFSKVKEMLNFPQHSYKLNGLEKVLFHFQEEAQHLQAEKQTMRAEHQTLQTMHQKLQAAHQNLQAELQNLRAELQNLQASHQQLLGSRPVRLARFIKRVLSFIGLRMA